MLPNAYTASLMTNKQISLQAIEENLKHVVNAFFSLLSTSYRMELSDLHQHSLIFNLFLHAIFNRML